MWKLWPSRRNAPVKPALVTATAGLVQISANLTRPLDSTFPTPRDLLWGTSADSPLLLVIWLLTAPTVFSYSLSWFCLCNTGPLDASQCHWNVKKRQWVVVCLRLGALWKLMDTVRCMELVLPNHFKKHPGPLGEVTLYSSWRELLPAYKYSKDS